MSQLLSARRGSVSAPDPFGEHAHLRRPSSSTLTIVRIPSGPAVHEPQKLPGRRFALSFAQPRQEQRTSPSTSPSTSPRIRPSSPHRFTQGIIGKPRLSAEQLVELARQAQSAPGSSPQSPVQSHRPQSPQTHSPTPSVTQATFTPLPDDIYLPFIYRAEEVSQLISTPPTVKLFSLLRQAFSNKSDDDRATSSGDPAQWSNAQLLHHLTKVDRDVCSDEDWVFAARKCIMSHSELIWERVKTALGVPPELDVEDYEEFPTAFEDDESAIVDSPLVGRVDHFSANLARRLAQEPGPGSDTSVDVNVLDDAVPQSPELSGHDEAEDGHLTFEPLLSNSSASIPASVSLGGGLGDIAEGAEDEAEEETDKDKKPQEEDDLIDPSQIQGLRISTGCKSPDESVMSSPVVARPFSVRSSSFSGLGSRDTCAGLSRVHSAGGRSYRRSRPTSMSGFDPKDWDVPYSGVGERGPGNPLFPSSFARLALGPTLQANNGGLRAMPPPSRYTPETGGQGHKPRSHSWALGRDVARSGYAATFASGE